MRNLAPVALMLMLILTFITVVSAQEKIKNPDLPQCLVFQWKLKTNQVDASWKNDEFFITRGTEGMVVYYGTYYNIASALSAIPSLPNGVKRSDLELVPFFNQVSIRTEDALMLLSDRTPFDAGQLDHADLETVSFTVYFATYDTPKGRELMKDINEPLSFEVSSGQQYAYSAGLFNDLSEAEAYAAQLREAGYSAASVNKYLNGEKLAVQDEGLLRNYIAYVERKGRVAISF